MSSSGRQTPTHSSAHPACYQSLKGYPNWPNLQVTILVIITGSWRSVSALTASPVWTVATLCSLRTFQPRGKLHIDAQLLEVEVHFVSCFDELSFQTSD